MANSTPFEPSDLIKDAASIRRLSRALITDRHLADDVAQEAFLSVARAQAAQGASAHIESRPAWLRTIVLNVARTMGRSKVRRAYRETAVARPDAIASTDRILEREEARRTLVESVLALDEPYRSTLTFRYLDELSLGDVALRTGVSKETVRTRTRRGLEQLRLRLDAEFGGASGTGHALALLALPGALLPPLSPATTTGALPGPAGASSGTLPNLTSPFGLFQALSMKMKITVLAGLATFFLLALPKGSDGAQLLPPGQTLDPGPVTGLSTARPPHLRAPEGLAPIERSFVAFEPPTSESGSGPANEKGSLQVTVKWSDGSPAAGVAMLFSRSQLPHAERHPDSPVIEEEWVVTDSAGLAELVGRWPGTFTIEAERGGWLEAQIESDQETQVDFVLDGGTDVTGTVVDPQGEPVTDAEVFVVNWHSDWRNSRQVTRTDTQGRFTIRTVGKKRSLGAAAHGYGPSKLFAISSVTDPGQPASDLAEVVLTLAEGGADVLGTVLDPAGNPVAGAVVTAVIGDTKGLHSFGFGSPSRWTSRSQRTGGDGRFALVGLPSGDLAIAASHPQRPQWQRLIELQPGQEEEMEVRFEEPAWIFGAVSLPDGTPAGRADVVVLAEPSKNFSPLDGPWDWGVPFRRPHVVCQADGSFEIGPITPGQVHLHASLGTTALAQEEQDEVDYRGTLQATLVVAPGQSLEWNPQLSLGASLRGHVLFADGSPIDQVFVTAFRSPDDWSGVETDEHGSFQIPNLKALPYRLSFELPPDAPNDAGGSVLYGVTPSEQQHVLSADYLPAAPVELCTVKVRLAGALDVEYLAGRTALAPWLCSLDGSSRLPLTADEDGVFIGTVDPGHHRLVLRSGTETTQLGDMIEAVAGEELDLGTVQAQPPGAIEVTLHRAGGVDSEVRVQVKGHGYYPGPTLQIAPGQTMAHIDGVATGSVVLEVRGDGLATEFFEIEVLAGEVTAVEVTMQQGALVPIAVDLERVEGFRRIQYAISSADGQLLLSRSIAEPDQLEWPIRHDLTLAPGSYRVEVQTSDGQVFSEPLVVDSIEPQPTFLARAH